MRSPGRRLPIALLLGFGWSGLVVVAVASVLYLAVWTGRQNTVDLARDRAELVIALVAENVRQQLEPVREQISFLDEVVSRQRIDPLADHRFQDLAAGALAATPHVTGIGFIGTDYRMVRVFRSERGGFERVTGREQNSAAREALEESRTAKRPYWGDAVWSETLQQPLINLRAPIHHDREFIGVMFAVLSVADLSAALGELAQGFGTTGFILVDRDFVLAHPALVAGFSGRSSQHPLPRIDEIGDPVLARIWQEGDLIDRARSEQYIGGSGHFSALGDATYAYHYQGTTEYGPRPWLIGTYLEEATLSNAFARLWRAAIAGMAILLLAGVLAWWIGRRMTAHIVAMAEAASSVRRLDFLAAERLPPSRFREIDDATAAFNAMLDGLQWFETYVPRSLVRRLMRLSAGRSVVSEDREVTVMFTDIAGFTTLSENMSAQEVAELLNHHFGVVDTAIDAEDGTVDKYLGDGVMAFWGAPDVQRDHARRACMAALAITAALRADNQQRARSGIEPIRLRIGLHSGPVTVGNVGGSSRVNYTIVGDTVNVANRLCELGRELLPSGIDVAILVSGDTAERAGEGFALAPFGAHVLRGRHDGTPIFQLLETDAAALPEEEPGPDTPRDLRRPGSAGGRPRPGS